MPSQPSSVQGSTPRETRVDAERADGPEGAENNETTTKKRKRKTLACYDCRRRKLKCDRIFPACGRCVKAGLANSCHYETLPDHAREGSSGSDEDCQLRTGDPIRDTVTHYAPRSATKQTSRYSNNDAGTPLSALLRAGKFEQLEERIARLENISKPTTPEVSRAQGSASHGASPYTPPGIALQGMEPAQDSNQQPEVEMMFFKGRSFHTQFYGASTPTSMISQFPELRAFMKAAIRQYSSLARVQSELKSLNVSLKIPAPTYNVSLDAAMLSQVPDKATADHLVDIYLQNIEVLYRVLHIPTFYNEYRHFWEKPRDARPCFVAQLLLVMASVSCLASNGPKTFIGRSSEPRETSSRWIQTVEDWMATQSRKNVAIENFQIWLLIAIAKHLNIIKKKRSWEVAGNIIRIYMCAGMHREPSILGRKITFFDQEMRRRLWATAVEWDLQASLGRGMPSSVAAMPSDCSAPMNLDDHSFDETTIQPPQPLPVSEFSDTSFLHLSSLSLRLRISLASLVNDPGAHIEYNDVLRWEEKIKTQLDAIPEWNVTDYPDNARAGRSLIAHVLLEVQLRQYLIWLHFPYASRTNSDSQSNYSRAACFNNACAIIDLHSRLVERENYALCILRSDGYLAAMTICHNVFASSLQRNNIIFVSLVSSFGPTIEKALQMQEEKIMRLGEGRNHYWFISAASSFVQAKVSPESATAAKQQAVDRVTRLFYGIITRQEDFDASTQSKTPALDAGAQAPLETVIPANPKDISLEQQILNGTGVDFDPFQHIDVTEWALDNLWPIDNNDWTIT